MATKLRAIEYGVPTDKSALTVHMGIERGVFARHGFDLSVRVVYGGPQVAAAFDAGEVAFGQLGAPPAINAITAGRRFRIVGSGARQRAHMYLGVRKGIAGYDALRGKRIGLLGMGSCGEWFARRILAKHGIAARDETGDGIDAPDGAEIVPLLADYPSLIDRVGDGRLDACVTSEPNIAVGEERGVLDFWAAAFAPDYLPDFQWEVMVANNDLIARDPPLVRALVAACAEAARDATDHADEFAPFMARRFGITETAARAGFVRELAHYNRDARINEAGFAKAVQLQLELGGIAETLPIDRFIDPRFQPEAA